jgi:hypothetical protein
VSVLDERAVDEVADVLDQEVPKVRDVHLFPAETEQNRTEKVWSLC